MNRVNEITKSYSEAIFALLKEYRRTGTKEVKESIRMLIRQYGNNIPAKYSKRAKELFPDADLESMKYSTQTKTDHKREKLILEHKETVYESFRKVCKANTIEEIAEALERSEVAWITREEDKRLTEAGYRKHRENPDEAYRECGIELL